MADLIITAGNVLSAAGATVDRSTGGAAITAGQTAYQDAASGKHLLADANSGTAAARVPDGIALNGAANGQPLAVHKSGPLTIGATLVPGTTYYQSKNPGGICPLGDLTTGDYPCVIGIATSASVLDVNITPSGVALP